MFKSLYISVGTYEFDDLIKQLDTEANLEVLKKFGFTKLIFQTGRYLFPSHVRNSGEITN
jgi:UDP-N-acetylglucosamine transferase subunit ALG13